jgi:hypothetical protein
MLGLLLGAFLAIAESLARGAAGAACWRAPLAAAIAGLFGAGGGLSASLLLESAQVTAGMSPLARTICIQCLGLGLLGLGVGLGLGVSAGGRRLIAGSAMGGILGCAIIGFLYPAGMGYLLPNAQTEHVVPIETLSRCIWLVSTALLTALVLTGLGRKGEG